MAKNEAIQWPFLKRQLLREVQGKMGKSNLKSGRASGKIPLGERIQVVVAFWGEPPEITRQRFYEVRRKLAEVYGASEAEIDREVLFVGLLNLGGKDNFGKENPGQHGSPIQNEEGKKEKIEEDKAPF